MDRAFPVLDTMWSEQVVAGLGIAALAATQIICSGKKPNRGIEMSWGLLWFAAAYAPESGMLTTVNSLFREHWMYLPSVGLFSGALRNRDKIAKKLFTESPALVLPLLWFPD